MLELLVIYLVGISVVCSLLVFWFYSPLKITLAKWIFGADVECPDDFDTLALTRWGPFFGFISGCYICMSLWLSIAIGVIVSIAFGIHWSYFIVTGLSYPSIAYAYRKIVS